MRKVGKQARNAGREEKQRNKLWTKLNTFRKIKYETIISALKYLNLLIGRLINSKMMFDDVTLVIRSRG